MNGFLLRTTFGRAGAKFPVLASGLALGAFVGLAGQGSRSAIAETLANQAKAPLTLLVERRVASMGTSLSLRAFAPSRSAGLAEIERAVREIDRVETLLTTWRAGGSLDRLNRAPVGEPVVVGREVSSLLFLLDDWRLRSGGAFDATVAPLMRAWDLRGAGRIPSNGEIDLAKEALGQIEARSEAGVAIRRHVAAGIDEGGWGKGYALDRAAAVLEEGKLSGFLIDFGGQVLAQGSGPDGDGWLVDVAAPRDRSDGVVTIRLRGGSLSTSGNSERSLFVGRECIGHLLDPRTGRPANDFGSVTVVAERALVADILSTALFVLGPETGLVAANEMRSKGEKIEALFLTDRPNRAVWTAGFPPLVERVADPDLRVALLADSSKNNR